MHGKKDKNTHILVLAKGEEVVASLLSYCRENSIYSASISGLGALSRARLALYDLSSKTYSRKDLISALELIVLNGNISKLKDEVTAHLHVALSDAEMNAFGGHLDSATVAATCEIIITELPVKITRKHDNDIGLNLIGRG